MFRSYHLIRANLGLFIGFGLLFSTHAFGEFGSNSRRYYLDPSRAEEILANTVRPKLLREQWFEILQGRESSTYEVRRGDTLWDISSREFGDAYLWRKLWQVNDYLSNPHQLSTGQILQYYREGTDPQIPTIRVPVVKLVPGGGSDLDEGSFINFDIRNQYRPQLLVVDDNQILGEISGGYSLKTNFSELDEIYLDLFRADTVRIGERFSIIRYLRTVGGSSAAGNAVGDLMQIVGDVRVVALGEKLVKVEIIKMGDTIQRGDKVIDMAALVNWSAVFNPPDELTARIVAGEVADHRFFSQGTIVLLNKGAADGMKAGYLFRVYRDEDPLTGSSSDVEPDSKGEIQVIWASEYASLGFVIRNKLPLAIGDTLIANQLFADPPPPPRREFTVISLDD